MKKTNVEYKIRMMNAHSDLNLSSHDLRIIYTVDGTCDVFINDDHLYFEKADVFAVNDGVSAKITPGRDSTIALISIEHYVLCDLLGITSFYCDINSRKDASAECKDLKHYIQKILLAHVSLQPDSVLEERGYCYLMLQLILTKFIVSKGLEDEKEGYSETVTKMLHYIHANYKDNINLGEISDILFISPSWASRIFFNVTGYHFPDYLKKVRLDHAKYALVESDDSVTDIAIAYGFSTPSAFNRVFKEELNMTPMVYRKNYAVQSKNISYDARLNEKVLQVLKSELTVNSDGDEKMEQIQVEMNQFKVWKKWNARILNVGPADVMTLARLQKQVLFVADKLDVSHIRIWNIFSDNLMIYGDGHGKYNFTVIDDIMDYCVDNRLKLYFDMAQRREVAVASEKEMIFDRGSKVKFASRREWLDMMKSFLMHIKKRYDDKIVTDWVFEFSFYLNDKPYYVDPNYSSDQVWHDGYTMVKSILPNVKVAGPGLLATPNFDQMRNAIRHFLGQQDKPDIFTAFHFPYITNIESESAYGNELKKQISKDFFIEQVSFVRSVLDEAGFAGDYWVTDWGHSLANRNYMQDSCFRGAYIAENLVSVSDYVDAMGIFYASDIININFDTNSLLTGSAGILSRHGLCKPAFYAYQFLNKMGKYGVKKTDHALITMQNENEIRILCHNSKTLSTRYYLREENSYKPDELSDMFVDSDPIILDFNIHVLKDQKYIVRHEYLNADNGSILDRWIDFQCSTNLSRSDMEYLDRIATPSITIHRAMPLNGTFPITVRLEPNEIRLIMIMAE